jgi:hypothetical protein
MLEEGVKRVLDERGKLYLFTDERYVKVIHVMEYYFNSDIKMMNIISSEEDIINYCTNLMIKFFDI